MSFLQQVTEFFAADSELANQVEGFNLRQAQIEMAKAVAQAIDTDSSLVVEAGTGTGKTFAYLIPALLSGKTVIISTATKALQQQLVEQDLPRMLKLCKVKGKVQILKGRENYLCEERLHIAELQDNSKSDWQKLSVLRDWSKKTTSGDLSECRQIDEADQIMRKVCARLEFCQAQGCNKDSECFYPKAKQKAAEAQIVVVNHHLFAANMALREKGFGELLPEADVYVFDEAHHLPDIAAQFLGFTISRFQLDELVREIKQAKADESPESDDLVLRANHFAEQVKAVNEALGKWEKRWTWDQLEANFAFIKSLRQLLNHFEALEADLEAVAERGKLLAALHKRTEGLAAQLKDWLETEISTQIRWAESDQTRFRLNLTPLSIAHIFKSQREERDSSWIFTSATLSVRGKFDYFQNRLGLNDAKTLELESPFDFQAQAIAYHPVGLPEPRDPDYIKICLRAIWPLLLASQGRAFLLFTSFRALNEAKEILSVHWQGTLLAQGEGNKGELLEKFRTADKAILLGTASFWEGVDVRGQALQLVMIDRIPFMPPDDPMVQARETYLKEKGLNGFAHFQIPEAITALKQGVGRLIRDQNDKGVLVMCDPRILTKGYGKEIVASLPKFRWVYEPLEAIELLKDA